MLILFKCRRNFVASIGTNYCLTIKIQNEMSGIKYFKTKTRLTYREGKPEVYKLRQLTYPPIKEKDLIKYAANSAHIPESTMQACVEAIVQGIVYFAINGMQVSLSDLGGFYVKVNSKTAHTLEECTPDTITSMCLSFRPSNNLRTALTDSDGEIVNAAYAVQETSSDDEEDGD